MTMVADGLSFWPFPLLIGGSTASSLTASSLTLDSTTDALAWVGRSFVSDSIATIYFRTGSIPGSGGDTVDVRIETVTNGRPTGTLWSANGTGAAPNITVAIADTDDNLWKTATLTNPAEIIPGDEFAIVIISSAGTPNIVLTGCSTQLTGFSAHYPLQLQNATGAYAQPSSAPTCFEWVIGLTTGGVKPWLGLLPLDGAGTLSSISSGGTEEIALHFQSPTPKRVIGMRAAIFNIAAASELTFSLWDSTGDTDAEVLAQVTEDGDFALSTTNDGYVDMYFNTAVTIAKDTVYYAGVRNTTANAISLGQLSAAGTGAAANAIRGFPIPATGEVYSANRQWTAGAAGAWSTTTTLLPLISLICDQGDDGAGGSGGRPELRGANL